MISEFPPARKRGLIIHSVLLAIAFAFMIFSLFQIITGEIGIFLTLYIFLLILSGVFIPIFGYRIYGLAKANYFLDRNFLQINWGMRKEKIPVSDIEWVKHISAFPGGVRMPVLRLPGGILGDLVDANLGRVEYLAADEENMILVGTARKVFAVSPEDTTHFMQAFNRIFEMGSLEIGQGNSQYVSLVIVNAWSSPINRFVWILNLLLNIGFFLWVSLLAPGFRTISLGYNPLNNTYNMVPGQQLILLPTVSIATSIAAFILGLVFYQSAHHKVLAQVVWVTNIANTLFFLASLIFILPTGTI
jgi:hypothetical protein